MPDALAQRLEAEISRPAWTTPEAVTRLLAALGDKVAAGTANRDDIVQARRAVDETVADAMQHLINGYDLSRLPVDAQRIAWISRNPTMQKLAGMLRAVEARESDHPIRDEIIVMLKMHAPLRAQVLAAGRKVYRG